MWPPFSGPQFSLSGKWRWLASPTLSLETVVHTSSWEEKAAFWQSYLPFLDFSLAKDTKARHWPIIPSQLKPCSPLLQLGNKGLLTSPQWATFWRSHVWSPHWTCGASAQLSGPGPRTACRYTDPNLLSPAKGEKEAEVAEHEPGVKGGVPEYTSYQNGPCLLLLNMQCVGKGVTHGCLCCTLHRVGAAHKKLLRIYDSTGFNSFHLWSNYKDKTSSLKPCPTATGRSHPKIWQNMSRKKYTLKFSKMWNWKILVFLQFCWLYRREDRRFFYCYCLVQFF